MAWLACQCDLCDDSTFLCFLVVLRLRCSRSSMHLLDTGAHLEVSLSAELKELAGSVQRVLMVPSSDQRLRVPGLCFNPG